MGAMAGFDLMDRFEAVLPGMNPADAAGEILAVMARIGRAASAAVYIEREDGLRWLAGDRLPSEVGVAIERAWQSQRSRILTGTSFTEQGAADGEGNPDPSWLIWMRRPVDGGLDAVYLAGPGLRPLGACSARLIRVAALLARLP
jgi:hypothetical protein